MTPTRRRLFRARLGDIADALASPDPLRFGWAGSQTYATLIILGFTPPAATYLAYGHERRETPESQ